ncbi:MAG: DoxX family membrane protein [Flavobacterium sp.]|nr:MAG: DoxX family membrane protein [Flavobacterium sp.]
METLQTNRAIRPTFNLLRLTFGLVPIVAGLDKFTDILADWEKYLHPGMVDMLPFSPHTFMMIVGVIEIVAGIIVLMRPAIGGYIVAAWLTLIALTLIASGNYLDVAVRDLVMAIAAFSLARISRIVA